MATIDKAESTVQGLRQIIQDLVAPEMRELKAEVRNINGRLDRVDQKLDRMDQKMDRLEQLVTSGFEGVRRQLDTYQDVQLLKERLARMEGERPPRPAA